MPTSLQHICIPLTSCYRLFSTCSIGTRRLRQSIRKFPSNSAVHRNFFSLGVTPRIQCKRGIRLCPPLSNKSRRGSKSNPSLKLVTSSKRILSSKLVTSCRHQLGWGRVLLFGGPWERNKFGSPLFFCFCSQLARGRRVYIGKVLK